MNLKELNELQNKLYDYQKVKSKLELLEYYKKIMLEYPLSSVDNCTVKHLYREILDLLISLGVKDYIEENINMLQCKEL